MHALMEHCDDTDLAVVQHLPVDEMGLITANIAVQAKLGRDRTPGNAAVGDGLKSPTDRGCRFWPEPFPKCRAYSGRFRLGDARPCPELEID